MSIVRSSMVVDASIASARRTSSRTSISLMSKAHSHRPFISARYGWVNCTQMPETRARISPRAVRYPLSLEGCRCMSLSCSVDANAGADRTDIYTLALLGCRSVCCSFCDGLKHRPVPEDAAGPGRDNPISTAAGSPCGIIRSCTDGMGNHSRSKQSFRRR